GAGVSSRGARGPERRRGGEPPQEAAARDRVAWHGALRRRRQAGPHRGRDRRGRPPGREGEVMGLLSWLTKKKSAAKAEPRNVEEPPTETTAEVAEALDSPNGAIRVDAARAMLDRARMGDAEAARAL